MKLVKTRISELSYPQDHNFSFITEHKINRNHKFDLKNVKILHNKRFLSRRLVSEMAHIKLMELTYNQTQTASCIYFNLK